MKWMCHFGGQAMIIAPSRLCLPSKVWCHILREDCQSKRLYSVVSARPAKSASRSRTMCKIPHICHHCQFGFTSSVLKQICSPRADCRASTASRMWLWQSALSKEPFSTSLDGEVSSCTGREKIRMLPVVALQKRRRFNYFHFTVKALIFQEAHYFCIAKLLHNHVDFFIFISL